MSSSFLVPRTSGLCLCVLFVAAVSTLGGCQRNFSSEQDPRIERTADGSPPPAERGSDAGRRADGGATAAATAQAAPQTAAQTAAQGAPPDVSQAVPPPTAGAGVGAGAADASGRTAPSPAPAQSVPATGLAQGEPAQAEPTQDDAGGRPWLSMSDLPYEYWETQYLNANRIGVTHYQVEKAGAERLTLTATSTLEIQRAGQPIRQTIVVQTIEQADGQVDSYFEDIQGGGAAMKVIGSVSSGKMPLRITNGENRSATTVPWASGTWGPMGVHQLLMRQPMQSGQRRLARVFLPQIHKTAQVTLAAGPVEDTTGPEGLLRDLVPVDVVMQLDEDAISNRVWINAQGQVQKSVMTVGLNLSSYRVPREVAERAVAQGQVELFEATSIKLDKPLTDPDQAQRIVYAVQAKNTDPFALLSRESNQTVRSETAFRSQLTVWRPSADGEAPAGPKQTPPAPECLAPSPLIKSDDPLIAKLAARLAAGATEPAEVAQNLTKGVYTAIRKKNFSRSFDSAQDVARTLEGDCTEHAVLLAALLRNQGIPARLASGVIVQTTAEQSDCVYHMWTEAWLGERWLPLDATRGSLAGCGHIKFLETPLADSNPYAALLPVMTSLGQLSISVEEVVR